MSTYKLNSIHTWTLAEAFRHRAAAAGDRDRANFEDWAEYWKQDQAHTRTHLLDRDDVHEFMEALEWWAPRFENWARNQGPNCLFSPSYGWLMARDVAIFLEAGDWVDHFSDHWQRAGKEVANV